MRQLAILATVTSLSIGTALFFAGCGQGDGPAGPAPEAGAADVVGSIDAAPSADAADASDDAARLHLDVAQSDVAQSDVAADVTIDAGPDVVAGGTLTLSLDPSLDGDDGDVKASALSDGALLDTTGAVKVTARVTGGDAAFDLTGIAPGDYFIRVNGDADDLVPTRIDDPSKDLAQRVGQKLRASMIGPTATPLYRVNTYSAGQNLSTVVKYSDGTPVAGSYPYVIATYTPPTIEVRVLGTGAQLTKVSPLANHIGSGVPFDAWLLNTPGLDHHGDVYMSDAGTFPCSLCHMNMTMRPMMHARIDIGLGWCFNCHYGTDGSGAGFVDPSQ